jgi:hypothetical protein
VSLPERDGSAIEPELVDLEPTARREERVRRAVELWKRQLVDVGGRNTLLYYRDLKQGTLDLGPGSTANPIAVNELLATRTVRLSRLFTDPEQLPVAAKRARTIRAKAREMYEERGLRTLNLAWGMASWTNTRTTSTPASPVLLRTASLATRGNMAEDFDVSLIDELEVNPTLLHVLQTEFAVELHGDDLLDLLDVAEADTPDPTPLFEHLAKAATDVPGFTVDPRVVLGNFSYAKLPMVKDLDAALDDLAGHDLIAAIAGDAAARGAILTRHVDVALDQPDRVPLGDEFLVLDADSSQTYAINAAVAGADLVIDGPPGTGKSQTISNLIASLIARGKTVLFVAEKRAALDAVVSRLETAGLGDLVLDLHDGIGNRKKVAEELAHSIAAVAQLPAADASHHRSHEKRREALVQHVAALHEPREPWGVNVYQAQVATLGVPAEARTDVRFTGTALEALDAAAAADARDALKDFATLDGHALLAGPDASGWAGAVRTGSITTSEAASAAGELVRRLQVSSIPDVTKDLNRAAQSVGVRPTGSIHGWREVVQLWVDVQAMLRTFDDSLYSADLAALADALLPAGKGRLARAAALVFDRRYRRARRTVRAFGRGARPNGPDMLGAVERAIGQRDRWRSVADPSRRPSAPQDVNSVRDRFLELVGELERLGHITARRDLTSLGTGDLLDQLADLLADQVLSRLPELSRLHAHLAGGGLEPLLRAAGERGLTRDQTLLAFDHAWHASILDAVSIGDFRIGAFSRDVHDRTSEEFRSGDHSHLGATPHRVRRACAERATRSRDTFQDEAHVVLKEARRKRGHIPVRQLFQTAPHVLTAIKPCWAMSPLVVAQVLPAEQRRFDVVIFDEASQILPADAVGSLLRADQAVVAGDPRQLPPTTFFLTSAEDDDAAEDEAALARLPSVLDVMSVILPPPKGTRTLEWHYRSRDERLIAFSNAEPSLYDWSLTTFPGAVGGDRIRHVLVPPRPGVPDEADSASDEVRRVVQLILEHAQLRPEESLGVIALGIRHADRIAESLRRACAGRSDLEAFFDENATEPFFVKNLERVQGDERDAIILSIGYARKSDGRPSYRFGPINVQGGERRLNVAITRAKRRMTVVSSFASSEMEPERLRSEGANMLQRYLAYAESGGSSLGPRSHHGAPMNAFERDVFHALTSAGIPVFAHYGTSGYRIDFAARHPTDPGRMVLAIETDGAMYRSARTTRDRDRLRREHLERLGWHFHRIWSTGWLRHRRQEIQRAVAAYESAVLVADGVAAPPPPDLPRTSEGTSPRRPPPRNTRPAVPQGLSILDYSQRQLVELIRWIESDTLLRTEDELLADVMVELGFERRGPRIVEAIGRATAAARRRT